MSTNPSYAGDPPAAATRSVRHSVDVAVSPALTNRNRLTTAFRAVLGIPHVILVGAPAGLAITFGWGSAGEPRFQWGATPGLLGAVAICAACFAWFAILIGGEYPRGLRTLAVFYLRWRVRSTAYLTLLRDEYPPFGDGEYPAWLALPEPPARHDRLTVAFRIILLVPQFIAMALLGVAWCASTILAWFSILFTGKFPPLLYHFGVGVLRWSTRVESYLLLLHDDYPPFSLE